MTWTVRRPVDAAAAAPGPAEGTLYGLTSQDARAPSRRSCCTRPAAGGASSARTFGYRTTCERGRIVVSDDVNISPEFDVAADGSFREVERFTANFADVIVRTTVVLRGQFDAAGSAAASSR